MPLTPGTRLGPYEIVSPLGAGGMGEVYRARDTRLSREVAVKVLPQHLSSNPEIKARFEREAKTVSSLNHPNICALYDVGKEGDVDFLVLELVEGETLAQRLTRGPLPLAEVLRLGGQVADALDRAHRAGVVHRDLKPGNVMITKAGAKLMDFGLARATGLAGGGAAAVPGSSSFGPGALTHSPTMAAPLTAEGTLVGTFQYMSPEQLEGAEADARSDIWALGCVLYEMVSGRRAFEGKSQASLISAIMGQAPAPLSQVAPVAPPALERVILTSIEKDPDERWQSAGDLRRELQWIAGAGTSVGGGFGGGPSASLGAGASAGIAEAAARARARARLMANAGWIAAGVLALVAVGLAVGLRRGPSEGDRLLRFALLPPHGFSLPAPAEAELSPDGSTLVFTAQDSTGLNRLFVRPFAGAEPRLVPGTENAGLPFWAPDGKALGYFAAGKLWRVVLDGSAPSALCEAPDPRGGAWSPAGVILFAPNNQGGIFRVSASGGVPTAVTHVDAARHERGHRYPQFLPDGKHFLYVAIGASDDVATYAMSIDGGQPTEVCRGGSMGRYTAAGYLLYLDSGPGAQVHRLIARRFDPASLKTSGEPLLVLDDVSANNFGYPNVTTAGGALVVQHTEPRHVRLDWIDRTGKKVDAVADDLPGFGPEVSPDGRRLVYGGFDPQDVFIRDLATGVDTRLTFANQPVINLAWSSDGARVSFARLVPGRGWEIHVKAADGGGPDSLLLHGPGLFTYPLFWSADDRWLVAQCSDSTGAYDLWKIPMAGQGPPSPYEHTPEQEQNATLSPDANWITFVATDGGHSNAYVQSFPQPGVKLQLSLADPLFCFWTSGGTEIIAANRRGELLSVAISTAGGLHQGAVTHLFEAPSEGSLSDISRAADRFLLDTPKGTTEASRFEVVLGWPRLLDRR